MTEVHRVYGSAGAPRCIALFDNRSQLKSMTVAAGQVFVIVGHVAVNSVSIMVHVCDFDSERQTMDPLQRMRLFLAGNANSEVDLFTFNPDTDGFGYVAKDLALRRIPGRVLRYLFKKQIRIELVGVEETVAEVDFG